MPEWPDGWHPRMAALGLGVALAVVLWVVSGTGVPGPAGAPGPVAAARAAADEQVYRWTDDEGAVHLSQGLASVPPQYRHRAEPLGSLTAPPSGPTRPAPDAASRRAVDESLRTARTAWDFLIVARRYRSRGWDDLARQAVDRAAAVAREASEWHAIAASYDALGLAQAADAARRRAQSAPVR
jgi:hypothetical protein